MHDHPVSISARLAGLAWHLWYPLLTGLSRTAPVTFLNYGYADPTHCTSGLFLQPADEPNRPCIQLYHRVVGEVDLRGSRVLEISCGHGGGASFLARYLGPSAVHAVDRNPRAINLCRRRHRGIAGLTFVRGDAQRLRYADGSFDVVLNVEAAHCYPDVPKFLAEVLRVLRPGGRFLYADFRTIGPALDTLVGQLATSGLTVEAKEDISAGVVQGMELNTPHYQNLIGRLAPRLLRPTLARFAGVTGSPIYQELASGDMVYLRCVLRKPTGGC